MRRLLMRFGFFRYCVLEHLKRERRKRAAFRWEYHRTMMSSLGTIVVTWAGIEMMIDHLIAWYHPAVGQHTIYKDQPVNFVRKMDYINKMTRDPKFDDAAKNGLQELRSRATALNKARKLLIHGVAFHRNGFSSIWHFAIREFDGARSTQMIYPVKDDDITEILRQMSALSADISPWILNLVQSTDEAKAMTSSATSK